MNILFLTLSQAISNINNRGIYPDLLRYFAQQGHYVYIVCPFERRTKKATGLTANGNVHTLGVKILNITKSNAIEKGFGTILIEYQYLQAIKKYFSDVHFELVMYSTPPITFNSVIRSIKDKYAAKSYLLLKDIFPQNAVDLGLFSKRSLFYWFFRKNEKTLYALSDYIGCMSPANVEFVLKHNPQIKKEHVEVCPNSIELKTKQVFIDKKSILAKYRIPENVPVFVYGGNLGKAQGIDFLIEILKSNFNRTDLFFLIVGNGTEYHKLDTWYNESKPDNALILPELLKEEYDQLIQACDVGMIFLDKRFTIPNYPSRLLSYLENKMPVLMATDTNTDIGKIAEENGYGLWTESGNIDKFNILLSTLIESPYLRTNMGQKGYNFLLKNYTIKVSYNIIMSHFS